MKKWNQVSETWSWNKFATMYSRVAYIVKIPLSPQEGAEMKRIVNIEKNQALG